jgi:hypothetical protein
VVKVRSPGEYFFSVIQKNKRYYKTKNNSNVPDDSSFEYSGARMLIGKQDG